MYLLWLMTPKVLEPYAAVLKDYVAIIRRMMAATILKRTRADETRIMAAVNALVASAFWSAMFRERLGITGFETADAVAVASSYIRAGVAQPER